MSTTAQTMSIGVPVVIAVNHQRIADLVTTALESPIGDWLVKATTINYGFPEDVDRKMPFYSQGAYWVDQRAGLELTVDKPTTDHPGKKTVRMEDFQLALILMATKDDGAYSRHFADFLRGNEDACTADLFMQFAVYGEEVYA